VAYANNLVDLHFREFRCAVPCWVSGRSVLDHGTQVGVTWNAWTAG
jgi:hypothetical protein